jgi:Phasin protein
MPTTQEEKPAKPRQRNRKTDQRKAKGEKKAEAPQADDPVSAVMAPMEAAQVEITPVEIAPIEITPVEITPVEITPVEITPVEIAEVEVAAVEPGPAAITPEAITMEKAGDAALSGEVLPPEVREHAPQTAGAQAIALAYGDYTRKSVLAGRFLVERLVTVRSFEEAIEIQGEFAKQAYANFVAHSERICELYGAWAQQYFGSLDKLATQWTRIGR